MKLASVYSIYDLLFYRMVMMALNSSAVTKKTIQKYWVHKSMENCSIISAELHIAETNIQRAENAEL